MFKILSFANKARKVKATEKTPNRKITSKRIDPFDETLLKWRNAQTNAYKHTASPEIPATKKLISSQQSQADVALDKPLRHREHTESGVSPGKDTVHDPKPCTEIYWHDCIALSRQSVPIKLPVNEPLKQTIVNREVKRVIHFTPIENLQSIFLHGILPIEELDSQGIFYNATDGNRFDGHPQAISLSISFPNYRMLYKKTQFHKQEFAILVISSKVLYEAKCPISVSKHNAATSRGKYITELTVESFNELFENPELRRKLDIPENYPTDPKTEILFGGIIPPSYIMEVHIKPDSISRPILSDKVHVVYNSDEYFKARQDYEYWSGTHGYQNVL